MNGLHEQSHPRPEELALASRGDLPRWRRWQVNWHVRHCSVCEHEVEEYRTVSARIKGQAAEALTAGERPWIGSAWLGR